MLFDSISLGTAAPKPGEYHVAKTKTTKKKTTSKTASTSTKTAKKAPAKKAPAKKKAKKKESPEVKVDRRAKADRRSSDRRQETVAVENERRQNPDRRKVARRRQIDPTTCERDYNGEEIEFMQALDAYKRAAGRMFPTCSEILEVIRDLGYRRLTPEEVAKLNPPTSEDSPNEHGGETPGLESESGDLDDHQELPASFMDDALDDFEE